MAEASREEDLEAIRHQSSTFANALELDHATAREVRAARGLVDAANPKHSDEVAYTYYQAVRRRQGRTSLLGDAGEALTRADIVALFPEMEQLARSGRNPHSLIDALDTVKRRHLQESARRAGLDRDQITVLNYALGLESKEPMSAQTVRFYRGAKVNPELLVSQANRYARKLAPVLREGLSDTDNEAQTAFARVAPLVSIGTRDPAGELQKALPVIVTTLNKAHRLHHNLGQLVGAIGGAAGEGDERPAQVKLLLSHVNTAMGVNPWWAPHTLINHVKRAADGVGSLNQAVEMQRKLIRYDRVSMPTAARILMHRL